MEIQDPTPDDRTGWDAKRCALEHGPDRLRLLWGSYADDFCAHASELCRRRRPVRSARWREYYAAWAARRAAHEEEVRTCARPLVYDLASSPEHAIATFLGVDAVGALPRLNHLGE